MHKPMMLAGMTYGAVVRRLRKARGYSQTVLAGLVAEALGLESYNQSNITRIENDNYPDLPMSTMVALAEVFELSLADMCNLMEVPSSDRHFADWLKAYTRVTQKQRQGLLALLPDSQ